MNPFSVVANGMKMWMKVAPQLGLCHGCKIRKAGTDKPCQSCGAFLCSNCTEQMKKRHALLLEHVRNVDPDFQNDMLNCEACGNDWGPKSRA